MEKLTILRISRRSGSWRWIVEDGLVVRSFGSTNETLVENPCTPQEFLERNNNAWKDNGLIWSNLIRADVMTRHLNPDGPKPFVWIVDERLF